MFMDGCDKKCRLVLGKLHNGRSHDHILPQLFGCQLKRVQRAGKKKEEKKTLKSKKTERLKEKTKEREKLMKI